MYNSSNSFAAHIPYSIFIFAGTTFWIINYYLLNPFSLQLIGLNWVFTATPASLLSCCFFHFSPRINYNNPILTFAPREMRMFSCCFLYLLLLFCVELKRSAEYNPNAPNTCACFNSNSSMLIYLCSSWKWARKRGADVLFFCFSVIPENFSSDFYVQ